MSPSPVARRPVPRPSTARPPTPRSRPWRRGALVLALGVAAAALAGCSDDGPAIEGVRSYSDLSREHVKVPADYPQTPPVGGDHASVWQNCGTYLEPIPSETGVHSMEHGAVWITYGDDLPAADVAKLQALGRAQTYLVVSPFEGLPSPLVATAWGEQLELSSVDDERLDEFLTAYRQGPQTPEPGAPCTNGYGTPQ